MTKEQKNLAIQFLEEQLKKETDGNKAKTLMVKIATLKGERKNGKII